MNLSLIADYADVLAALGIILSLFFVAFQIRRNTREVSATHLETVLDRNNELHARLYDHETAAIVLKGQQSYENLDDIERVIFGTWMREFITTFSATNIIARQGILRPALRDAYDQRVHLFVGRAGVLTDRKAIRIDEELEPPEEFLKQRSCDTTS